MEWGGLLSGVQDAAGLLRDYRPELTPTGKAVVDGAKAIGRGLLETATLPARVMQPNPYRDGTEESQWYADNNARQMYNWGPEMALNMVGIGGPLAMIGAPSLGASGGRMATKSQIDLLANALERSGVQIESRHGSGLSSSQYLEARVPDWGGYNMGPLPEDATRSMKIRASDHELPPTYGNFNGRADVEIGPHGSAISDTWHHAAKHIFETAGVTPDKISERAINKVLTKEADARAAELARKSVLDAERAQNQLVAKENWGKLLKEYGLPETASLPAGLLNPKSMKRILSPAAEIYAKPLAERTPIEQIKLSIIGLE